MKNLWQNFRIRPPQRHYRRGVSAGWTPTLSGVLGNDSAPDSSYRDFAEVKEFALERDQLIEEEVRMALEPSGLIDREVFISVSQGEVELTGSVESYELKKELESWVEDLPGVHDVMNRLAVNGPSTHPQ